MSERTRKTSFIVIDGNELSIEPGETVLEAARRAEIEIPTLCWDPRLTPAGACRLCLVEISALSQFGNLLAVELWDGVKVSQFLEQGKAGILDATSPTIAIAPRRSEFMKFAHSWPVPHMK